MTKIQPNTTLLSGTEFDFGEMGLPDFGYLPGAEESIIQNYATVSTGAGSMWPDISRPAPARTGFATAVIDQSGSAYLDLALLISSRSETNGNISGPGKGRHFRWRSAIENVMNRQIGIAGSVQETTHGRVFPDDNQIVAGRKRILI
jgi:hypothetical protein